MPRKRTIIANPDEPNTGDFAYGLYDKAHPVFGDQQTIDYFRGQLKGLRGKEIKTTFRGMRRDEDGTERRFNVTRTFKAKSYNDFFGPGSAYASAMHQVREKYSDEELIILSFEIEEV